MKKRPVLPRRLLRLNSCLTHDAGQMLLDTHQMSDLPALTVKEVAMLLRVDEKTVYRLAKKRALPGFKVAGAWRFKRDDIDAWIETQKAAPQ